VALKFQYNKTTIQHFKKQLSIRERALPILQNKETALRMEVKELSKKLEQLEIERKNLDQELQDYSGFWNEFPEIMVLNKPDIFQKKIVGVKVPEIGDITFQFVDMSWWNFPAWVPAGMSIIQKVITLDLRIMIILKQFEILSIARKKTTQKVNLYEKVQIPEFEEAILKIKRFLEDKENISKAAQKIVKRRKERRVSA
jgi:V/A-type H+-transporting ATPase subunit D